MKKILTFLLSLSMITSFAIATASATDLNIEDLDFYAADGDGVIVSTTDVTETVDVPAYVVSVPGRPTPPVARRNLDLSDGYVSLNWDLPAEDDLFSADVFKTNTQKIKVQLKGDTSVSLTVKLFDQNNNHIGSETKNVNTILETEYNFSALTAANYYYIQIINNGQKDVHLSGTISQ